MDIIFDNPLPDTTKKGWEYDPDWGFVTHDPHHIVVEAGHFYTANGPSLHSLTGWQIAEHKADDWQRYGGKTVLMALFVDDFHSSQPTVAQLGFDYEGEETFFAGADAEAAVKRMVGWADLVFKENDFAAGAFDAVLPLVDQNLASTKKGVVTTKGVRLGSDFDPNDPQSFQPTCVLLDYMLLCAKAQYGVDQYVVLPPWYLKQQRQLATVIGKLTVPKLAQYTCIYFVPQEGVSPADHETFEEVYHG